MSSKIQPILVTDIVKSRQNLLEIFEAQKYKTSEYANFSNNEVNIMFQNNQLDMLLEEDTIENKRKVYIRYNLDKKLTESVINTLIEDLYNDEEPLLSKQDTLFIIIKEEVNDTMKRIMKHVWEKEGYYIIFESINRLQYNALKHSLVPKHRILDEEEIKPIFDKLNISSRTQLPTISRFDPISKLIGLRPNQICHILRPSKTAILTNYYRVCE